MFVSANIISWAVAITLLQVAIVKYFKKISFGTTMCEAALTREHKPPVL